MKLSALVLAGGAARRMGRDKRWLRYQGAPLVVRAVDAARAITSDVRLLVSEPDERTTLAPHLGQQIHYCVDPFPGSGPLGALLGALPDVSADYALLLAIDYPLLTGQFLKRMKRSVDPAAAGDVVVPLWQGVPQVTCAFYRPALYASLRSAWDKGQRSLRGWVESLKDGVVGIPEPTWAAWSGARVFYNVNTADDWRTLLAAAKSIV